MDLLCQAAQRGNYLISRELLYTDFMAKGTFWSDTFEKLEELGTSTVKQSAKQVAQTFNPVKIFEKATGQDKGDQGMEKLEKGSGKKDNHTPLDFETLKGKYENQDKQKTEALRQRLFQLVKTGEERQLDKKKQEEEEKKRKEEYLLQDKKRKEAEKKRQEQMAGTPHGKERRSIFSAKKMAKREQTEVKPASGKQ